jgi:hypothetical protein
MSGDWPPEWDDPEEEFPSGAEQQDATGSTEMGDARLAEVTAYLASVPAPVMPDAVMSRISTALAAEAAVRAGDGARADTAAAEGGMSSAAGATADSGRTLGTPPARARVRRHRGGARGHHVFRSIPLKAVTSVMAGLVVIAGIGYGISRTSGATYSSSSAASSSGESSAVAAPAAPAGSASGTSAAAGGFLGASPQFVVTVSGTKYQAATLAAQVRARLATPSPRASAAASSHVPGPAKTSSAASSAPDTASAAGTRAPTSALRGCVLHLTGGQPPRLVDQATYRGTPAYVIASSSHVWVVGLGCTATNAELITSVALGS